jgi:hypothetical protein
VVAKRSYGDKWYYQQDNELYTCTECFPFTGQYYLLIKQKLAMDLMEFSVEFYLYVYTNNVVLMGLTTPFQIRSM